MRDVLKYYHTGWRNKEESDKYATHYKPLNITGTDDIFNLKNLMRSRRFTE